MLFARSYHVIRTGRRAHFHAQSALSPHANSPYVFRYAAAILRDAKVVYFRGRCTGGNFRSLHWDYGVFIVLQSCYIYKVHIGAITCRGQRCQILKYFRAQTPALSVAYFSASAHQLPQLEFFFAATLNFTEAEHAADYSAWGASPPSRDDDAHSGVDKERRFADIFLCFDYDYPRHRRGARYALILARLTRPPAYATFRSLPSCSREALRL